MWWYLWSNRCNLNIFSAPVAFKLSRKRTDDTFKLLHTILFGRRGKVIHILKTFVCKFLFIYFAFLSSFIVGNEFAL